VNSNFTANIFVKTFQSAKEKPSVLYPAVDMCSLRERTQSARLFHQSYLLAINRFEEKKNIRLAIDTFKWLLDNEQSKRRLSMLVIAGII